jgi:hypothetical protein
MLVRVPAGRRMRPSRRGEAVVIAFAHHGKSKPNPKEESKERPIDLDVDDSGCTLSFGVFALRELRSGSWVWLDWE